MLNQVLGPLAGASSSDPDHDKRGSKDRLAYGIILVPVATAAAAAVSFNQAGRPQQQQQTELGGAVLASAGRTAFESGSSTCTALHYETVRGLAEAFSSDPRSLHTWVGAESDRTHELPDAFREVWAQHERDGRKKEQQLLRTVMGKGEEVSAAAARSNDCEGTLDSETLQARLRQRMRHAMHDTLYEGRPESYYVEHPDVDS